MRVDELIGLQPDFSEGKSNYVGLPKPIPTTQGKCPLGNLRSFREGATQASHTHSVPLRNWGSLGRCVLPRSPVVTRWSKPSDSTGSFVARHSAAPDLWGSELKEEGVPRDPCHIQSRTIGFLHTTELHVTRGFSWIFQGSDSE